MDGVAGARMPGCILIVYCGTAAQLSELSEEIRADRRCSEPSAWESMVRGWHLEGLAVRPQHRMVGHPGFLLTTRRMAEGVAPPPRRRRPAKAAEANPAADLADAVQSGDVEWSGEELGERPVSDKKLRKVRREQSD